MRTEPLPSWPGDPAEALAAYRPESGHGPWNVATAAHLLRRALGGSSPAERARVLEQGPAAALDALFRPPAPERLERWERLGRRLAPQGIEALAGWWLLKLVEAREAPGPRLTLFWHDHFATSADKVTDTGLLLEQHQTFVRYGEGPFEDLLRAVAWDPAMLRFLDGDSNRRGLPNENLAREILELFSLGPGHYTEHDIREAARALTGRTVRRGRPVQVPEHHDPGPKTVLGQKVQDGDDLVRVIVAREACPRFLIRKLWRFYVSPEPREDCVELLAGTWREHGLEVRWLVRTLLASRAFFSREAWRSRVKSPVELVVDAARAGGLRPDYVALARACTRMGQSLFRPPGVQGWQEGEAWIHSAAWIERCNFAARFAAGGFGSLGLTKDPAGWDRPLLRVLGGGPAALTRRLALLFLDRERGSGALEQAGSADLSSLLQTTLCLPESHLG